MEKVDKYKLLGDKILQLMEQGLKPWEKPWLSGRRRFSNLVSGHIYTGVNPLLCNVDMLIYGYSLPYFVGFAQAKDLHWSLAKGSKATFLRWSGVIEVEREDGEVDLRFVGKWIPVYNCQLFDDSKSEVKIQDYVSKLDQQFCAQPVLGEHDRQPAIDKYVASTTAVIKVGKGYDAAYSPAEDIIFMPQFEQFVSTEGYYSTLLHELTHWTGHSSRCNRRQNCNRQSTEYAFEELVAEIGSSILCENFGISNTIPDHASYIGSWLNQMRGDKSYFWKAMGLAQSAVAFLEGLGKEKVMTKRKEQECELV